MSDLIDIEVFCNKDDLRKFLQTPFSLDDRTYATTGYAAICVPFRPGFPSAQDKLGAALDGKFAGVEARQFGPLPSFEWPDKTMCHTCNGNGKAIKTPCQECDEEGSLDLESNYSTYYDLECKSCDGEGYQVESFTDEQCPDCKGEGKVYERNFAAQTLPGLGVTVNLIKLAPFMSLPDLEVSGDSLNKELYFRFRGGYGLLLGCNP